MRLKSALIFGGLLIIALLISTLQQPNLLRYANTSFCSRVGSGNGFAGWYKANDIPLLIMRNSQQSRFPSMQALQLWVVDPETGETVEDTILPISSDIRDVALAESGGMVAVTKGYGESAELFLYSFGLNRQSERSAVIEGAERAVWHPGGQLLAAIYFPTGFDQGSNIVVLFDVSGPTPIQGDLFEMKRVAISEILGWSHNGQTIAVLLYDKYGETPYYIFTTDRVVKGSLFDKSRQQCVMDAQWSPKEEVLAFSGKNVETGGWDIFLETVASVGGKDRSLQNLTHTPGESEGHISWSPEGNEIAYVKIVENGKGPFRQELFIINLRDPVHPPIQLTDTPEAHETSPIWLSEAEVAYLTWSSTTSTWSLNVVSTLDHQVRTVLQIPEAWYRIP